MPVPMMMAAMLFLDFNRLSAFTRAGVGFGQKPAEDEGQQEDCEQFFHGL